jgi:Spy/CpxP family protein refolding chaperone
LHGILTDAHGQLDDLREKYGRQIILILDKANEQITTILTPEQQARFEELKRKNHPLMRALQPNPAP